MKKLITVIGLLAISLTANLAQARGISLSLVEGGRIINEKSSRIPLSQDSAAISIEGVASCSTDLTDFGNQEISVEIKSVDGRSEVIGNSVVISSLDTKVSGHLQTIRCSVTTR